MFNNNLQCKNLVDVLCYRGEKQPDKIAYMFLIDGETESHRVTYQELDKQARAYAWHLQSICQPGERALLLYPPGLEFIAAFFGCLYAGVVAVPAYPPRNQKLSRLQAIVADAEAAVVLTTETMLDNIKSRFASSRDLTGLPILATDNMAVESASKWQKPEVTSDSLAFLQYTSGSTGKPKGVMVSHGNLLHNQQSIQACLSHTDLSTHVSWLPLYHDMGLANAIQALFIGAQCIMMPPAAFLQRPRCWLSAISRYQAHTSGGPNFAYELCVQKVSQKERQTLNLSSWKVAFNGAEPIRWETLERFESRFSDCGFQESAFSPCYGLAESIAAVTGSPKGAKPICSKVSKTALEQNIVVAKDREDPDARILVSSGKTWLDRKVVIVDPLSRTPCDDKQVGEIWLSGSSVAMGYWRRPQETEETFFAYLANTGDGPFLRTGDWGFLQDGELFVTGRLKDLIIVRGRNYYPQDIEQTVEQSHPELRPNCSAAFSVDVDGTEKVVVAAEVELQALKGLDVSAVVESIREAVWSEYELQVYGVLLLRTASIPKTSSGKIQRHACRQGFLEGSLNVVGSWQQGSQENRELPLLSTESLETWLAEWIGSELGVAAETIDPQKSLFYYGLDSVTAMQLALDLEELLGRQISPSLAWDYPTIAALTRYLREERTLSVRTETVAPLVGEKAVDRREFPLSSGQKALWFLYKLAPFSWAYNIILAVRIGSQVDVVALRGALQALVDRHQTLRTTYIERDGEPRQRIIDDFDLPWTQIDVSSWNAEELKAKVTDDGRRPFNLESSAFRVSLFTREASDHVLLLTAHHISCDFWSMLVLMDELKVLYTVREKSAQKSGSEVSNEPLPLSYTDWVREQNKMLAGSRGEELWNYWRQELEGALDAVLDLPTDKPRPPVQTYNGATHSFQIGQELTGDLRRLAQELETTLYTLLLAAFCVLLYRYTGQEDIMVGYPTSGRTRLQLENMVGYLVNPVVLPANMLGNPTFSELLRQVRQKVAGAIGHQEYPFGLLVEKLQPQRDGSRSPLFDVMFVHQQPQRSEELAQLLYSPGKQRSIKWGELELGDFEITQYEGLFDLTLETILADRALRGAFKYNIDLFSSETISRMAGHFGVLLEAIVSNPLSRVDQLPLLTEQERHQILVTWNNTATEYPSDKCIHHLFSEQVEKTPDTVAVMFAESQLTYRELNSRANKLAHYLRSLGVGPEVLVGLCVERSLNMVVAILGILKAGGAYVPLDPAYPPERLAFMLWDSQAGFLLSESKLIRRLPDYQGQVIIIDTDWQAISSPSSRHLTNSARHGNLAYVIYTSGSTGKPKGVAMIHGALVNLICWQLKQTLHYPKAKTLQFSPFSFDVSFQEIFTTWCGGGTLILISEEMRRDPVALLHLLAASEVERLFLPFIALQQLAEVADSFKKLPSSLKEVITAGEQLQVTTAIASFFTKLPNCRLQNQYGPSETHVVTALTLSASPQEWPTLPAIGRPIANTQIYLLDESRKPVPIGMAGELYVGGVCLARGYINRGEL